MKKFLSAFLAILLAAVITFSGCSGNKTSSTATDATTTTTTATTRTITDMAGVQVVIPTKINKIADAWRAHNEVVTMLGAGSKIVATCLTADTSPWLYKVNPQMKNAVVCFTTDVNMEELIKSAPDIVFVSIGTKYIDKITSAGIPVVQLNFTDFDSLKQCYKLTGDILGTDTSKQADAYIAYLNSKMQMLSDITSKIPDASKPSVLHIASVNPIQVDGSNTIINSWIQLAGGKNAAIGVTGNFQAVSIEQILTWNPDKIILMNSAVGADTVFTDSTWAKVPAVKNNQIFRNPEGAFPWDRYSAEEALQIQWTAKTLNPDKFTSLDMVQETKNFYKTFMNYSLTSDEAQRILNGQKPLP
jgi:iron complex transport system substrate-binding protein